MGGVFLQSEVEEEEDLNKRFKEILAQINKISGEKNELAMRLGIVEAKCRKIEADKEKISVTLEHLYEMYLSMNNEIKATARISNKENVAPQRVHGEKLEQFENSTLHNVQNNKAVRFRQKRNLSTDSNPLFSTNEKLAKITENDSRQRSFARHNSSSSVKNNMSQTTTKPIQPLSSTSNAASKRNSSVSTSSTTSLSSVSYDTILGVL